MKDRVFIDTNILIYLYSEDEPEKQAIALDTITDGQVERIISTQVVGEFVNVLSRKFQFDPGSIKAAVDDFKGHFGIALIEIDTIEQALDIMKQYRFSFWDSMIISSAMENDCSILYSEDLQDSQIHLGQLKIINPFALIDAPGL